MNTDTDFHTRTRTRSKPLARTYERPLTRNTASEPSRGLATSNRITPRLNVADLSLGFDKRALLLKGMSPASAAVSVSGGGL
jgi:hypothetical protein